MVYDTVFPPLVLWSSGGLNPGAYRERCCSLRTRRALPGQGLRARNCK